ncbi:MAG TPA: ABC transporter permease [Candidatus Limnocylindrales bacterium]|nr:ABC transporter permease [Candidatus Limnocylindrales bacterium]
MELLQGLLAWLSEPERWQGPDSIPVRLGEHVLLSGLPVLVAIALAVPIGLAIGHTGRFRLLVVTLANIGRALPTFALLVIFLPIVLRLGLGLGFWPTFLPLLLLAIPPILVGTYVAIAEADPDVREAGRAMGMRPLQVLLRVELPLGLPLVFAGIRIAAVQVIATATLGAIVASGGLGRYIVDGLALRQDARIIVGAVLVAVLALVADRLLGMVERGVGPRQDSAGVIKEQLARPA